MGQQQLLLIVLSVIIVGVAIAVGVTQFQSNAVESNRQAVISDLVNYAAKAQRYYRTPAQLGGGSQNFKDFQMSPLDTANANGTYTVSTTAPSGASKASAGGTLPKVSSSATTIYIVGSGQEIGNDGTNPVKAYATVTANSITTTILN
jgi:Tfp pilus assembly protein PilE